MKLYRQDSPGRGRVWIDNQYGDRVAELDVGQQGAEMCLILGSLFSAAPKLLEALEMMLEKFSNDIREGEAGYDAVCMALEAVAEAKGE